MVDHTAHPSRRPRPGQAATPKDDAPHEAPQPIQGGAKDGAKDGERVAKALARAGVASRRDVERLIAEGRVALNGHVLTTPAVKIGPGDVLTVNGAVISDKEPTRLWRYHKPAGLLTAHKDPKNRPTVFDHLPDGLPRVISVGRLDLASEGLLLLTNDGEVARLLELPTTGWVRRYRARAYGHATQEKLDKLKDGITVEGVRYGSIEAKLDKVRHAAADVDRKGPANIWVSVAITEGKNREVRRVLEHIGLKVNRLIRLAYGPFVLGTLPIGAAEEVGPRVIREQLAELIPADTMPKGERAGPLLMPKGKAPVARSEKSPRRAGPAAEAPPKKEFKPGWAKPKRKVSPHAAPSKPRGAAAAKPKGTDLTFGRPSADKARQARVAKAEAAAKPARGRVAPPRGPTPSKGPRRKG